RRCRPRWSASSPRRCRASCRCCPRRHASSWSCSTRSSRRSRPRPRRPRRRRSAMALDVEKVVEDLSSLTVLELVSLKEALEEKWAVSAAAAAVAVAAPAAGGGGGGGGEEAAEEKTSF